MPERFAGLFRYFTIQTLPVAIAIMPRLVLYSSCFPRGGFLSMENSRYSLLTGERSFRYHYQY